ncbi:hypothetical protein M514_12519 [Trichuris suis]|uniref:Uncharacterized protein n=1 Tax=Trichuris suis TaxID=68888 RepID=A0A085MX74_9BILA|nr:hypothetical protein M514_12519 [Trichuris suis]
MRFSVDVGKPRVAWCLRWTTFYVWDLRRFSKIDKYGHRVILFYEFNPSHRAVASAQHTCAAQSSLIGEQMSPVPV